MLMELDPTTAKGLYQGIVLKRGNLVTWRSRKRTDCVRSSAEFEYRVTAQAVAELLWLKILLKDWHRSFSTHEALL